MNRETRLLITKTVITSQFALIWLALALGSAYTYGLFTDNLALEAATRLPAFVIMNILFGYLFVFYLISIGYLIGRRIWWKLGHKPTEIQPELKQRLLNLGEHVRMQMAPITKVRFLVGRMSYNAFTTKKGIIVGEKILRDLSDIEVEGIIAHEIAHVVNGDRWKKGLGLGVGSALVIVILGVFSFTRSSAILAGTLWCLFVFLGIPLNWKIEYDADLKAARYLGFEVIAKSLEKLQPNVYGGISFSHPLLTKRIMRLRAMNSKLPAA